MLDEMQPERVLIIGKEVNRVIEPILDLKNSITISQPTAFLNAQAIRNLYKVVFQEGQKAINHV